MKDLLQTFLTSNKAKWRLARTVVQAALGFLAENMCSIIACTNFSANAQAIIVAATMAVLSPIMSELGCYIERDNEKRAEEICEDEFCGE